MAVFLSEDAVLTKLASLLSESSIAERPGWWSSIRTLDQSLDPNKLPLAVYFGFVVGEVCCLSDVIFGMYSYSQPKYQGLYGRYWEIGAPIFTEDESDTARRIEELFHAQRRNLILYSGVHNVGI